MMSNKTQKWCHVPFSNENPHHGTPFFVGGIFPAALAFKGTDASCVGPRTGLTMDDMNFTLIDTSMVKGTLPKTKIAPEK